MKVLHVLGGVAVSLGGPAVGPGKWAQATRPWGVESVFLTTDYRGEPRVQIEAPIEIHPAHGRVAYSPGFRRAVRRWLGEVDVCHLHGVWLYPILAAAAEARRRSVPYIVTPHGMLDRYHFAPAGRWLRNQIYLHTLQYPSLAHADGIHYLTSREQAASAYRRPAAEFVLPGLVPVAAQPPSRSTGARLLSLSLLHPRKNVESLIRAVPLLAARLGGPVQLKIAGPGPADYVARLRRLAQEVDPEQRQIEFLGAVSDARKVELLAWASAFCLVSFMEAQSLGLLEALAEGLPVITSAGADPPFTAADVCGEILADPNPQAIAAAMHRLLRDEPHYARTCASAHAFVARRFSSAVLGAAWARQYRLLTGSSATSGSGCDSQQCH